MYKKIRCEAYNIHLIKTDKFKKTIIKINFKNELDEKELIRRGILKSIFFEANSIYSSKRLLNIETENLYNLDIYSDVMRSGNAIMTTVELVLLNEKYASGLFEDCVKFTSDILFKPKTKGNKFAKEDFLRAKKNLEEAIDVFFENPASYAMTEVYKKLFNIEGQATRFGDISYLSKVKNEEVYNSYINMLNNDKIDIFVAGNIPDNAVQIIEKYLKFEGKRKNCSNYYKHKEFKNNLVEYKETKPYSQSTLIFGYKVADLTPFESQYVLPIYGHILGGGADSKLFKNIREKNSLCYSIGTNFRRVANIFLITAGINATDYKKAVKLIKAEVKDMNEGNFTKEDIKKAKLAYLSAYESYKDSISSVLGDYYTKEILDTDLVSTRKRKIMKVTKKDIMKVIPKVHPEIVYLLEGSKE